jgi:hypothetical protein
MFEKTPVRHSRPHLRIAQLAFKEERQDAGIMQEVLWA